MIFGCATEPSELGLSEDVNTIDVFSIIIIIIKSMFIFLQDFLVHLIHQEKAQADALDAPGSRSPCNVSKEILADPVMFIRRWIGEVCIQTCSRERLQRLAMTWEGSTI